MSQERLSVDRNKSYTHTQAASLGISHDGAVENIYSGRLVGASLFANAAIVRDGARVDWIGRSQGVIMVGGREIVVDGAALNESALGAAIVTDKELTKEFLVKHGIRTPRGLVVHSPDQAVEVADSFNASVVVKPVGGGQGHGVTVGVYGAREVREAYAAAVDARRSPVLVEEHIDIEVEYRCMATPYECVAVVLRALPRVTGDGSSTIRELINAKNMARKSNPALHNLPIPVDRVVDTVLRRQGMNLESVPVKGEEVLIRNVGGLSGGGEPHQVLGEVSDKLKTLAYRAVAAIPGLAWGGVDIAIERTSGLPYVIEINCRAGYGAATFPVKGQPKDVASVAWRDRLSVNKIDTAPSPSRLTPHDEPIPLSSVAAKYCMETLPAGLNSLFFQWLRSSGYDVDETRRTATHVTGSDIDKWFTPGLASDTDLLASRGMLRKHVFVRSLLARKGVPRVRGRRARKPDEVDSFTGGVPRRLIATPVAKAWKSNASTLVMSDDSAHLFELSRIWFIQLHPRRRRLTVFATRESALAVTGRTGFGRIESEALVRASDLAVSAVRAIPELRWAFVDLVQAPRLKSVSSNDVRWNVEGLRFNYQVFGTTELLSGHVESVFTFLCGKD